VSGERERDSTAKGAAPESAQGAAPDAGVAEVSFNDALAELESILGRLERDDVDLDRLAVELGRAAELLEVCRRKIRKAELDVSHIVEKLGEDAPR
jgi:exodeoxyribonuclease VII small subunit